MLVRYVCQSVRKRASVKRKKRRRDVAREWTAAAARAWRGGGCLKSWRKTVAVFTGAAGGKTFQTAAFEWSSIVRRTHSALRRAAPFHGARIYRAYFFARERKRWMEKKSARARASSLSLFWRFIFISKFVVNLSATIYCHGTLRANESDLVTLGSDIATLKTSR